MVASQAPVKIEITHKTIIFTVGFLLGLTFLYQVRNLILFLFIAVILMTALNPFVDRLEKYRIPRGISTVILYILLWFLLSFTVASLAPLLVEQTARFFSSLPVYVEQLSRGRFDLFLLQPQLAHLPPN